MKIKFTLAAIAGWFALALAPVTATRAADSFTPGSRAAAAITTTA